MKNLPKYKINEMRVKQNFSARDLIDISDSLKKNNQIGDPTKISINKNI